MKVKTIITDITHNDLVDLISAAAYGSSWLGIDYNLEDYWKCPDKKDDDCIEDKISRILLNGGEVTFYDMYAEDEDDFYQSKIQHKWDEENQCMDYTITISDIENGLEKAALSKGYLSKCFQDLLNEDGDLDQPEAEAIVQVILWGEEIYG